MTYFGSNPNPLNFGFSSVIDQNGNLIVSPDNSFGASPLGEAARTQALYGIPNARFSLLPNDPLSNISVENPLPYWTAESFGSVSAISTYNDTEQTYSVTITPTTAGSGDFLTLKTRSYLLNDTDLNLRQKAFVSLTKNGTMGTAEWAGVLTATYFDAAGAQLSSFAIGTVSSASSFTGISGFTTSGTAVIATAAQYVDIDFTVTASATVTGTATVSVESVLLQTSLASSQSFILTETFTSSSTWNSPTGVTALVALVGAGAGGGGAGGGLIGSSIGASGTANAPASRGGGAGAWTIVRDVPVTSGSAYSVGIGAGGAGGTAQSFSKAFGGTATAITNQASGAAGGATTFGTFFSIAGGGGATGAVVSVTGTHANGTAGTAGVASAGIFGATGVAGKTGEASGNATTNWDSSLIYPYTTAQTGGAAGAAGSSSGTAITAFAGTAGTISSATANMLMSGAAADSSTWSSPFTQSDVGNSGNSTGSGGAAGANSCVAITATGTGTVTCTAGAAGSAATISGCGGSGGGNAIVSASAVSTFRDRPVVIASGRGGSGQQGFVTVVFVG